MLPKLDPLAVTSAIDSIKEMDLSTITIDEIIDALTPLIIGFSQVTQRIHPGLRLYRARAIDRPETIRKLMYPPANKAYLSRANRDGSPILYTSNSREATFFEVRPPVGSTVAVAQWVTTAPLLVNHVGYTESVFAGLGSERTNSEWGVQSATASVDDTNRQVASFLAYSFTQIVGDDSNYPYKLSAAISEKLIVDDQFDALAYPTIAMKGNAENFAIKTQFADSSLLFQRAELLRVDSLLDFGFEATIIDTASALGSDGKIIWKGNGDQWSMRNQGDELTLVVEHGKWVVYDKFGNVVDPD